MVRPLAAWGARHVGVLTGSVLASLAVVVAWWDAGWSRSTGASVDVLRYAASDSSRRLVHYAVLVCVFALVHAVVVRSTSGEAGSSLGSRRSVGPRLLLILPLALAGFAASEPGIAIIAMAAILFITRSNGSGPIRLGQSMELTGRVVVLIWALALFILPLMNLRISISSIERLVDLELHHAFVLMPGLVAAKSGQWSVDPFYLSSSVAGLAIARVNSSLLGWSESSTTSMAIVLQAQVLFVGGLLALAARLRQSRWGVIGAALVLTSPRQVLSPLGAGVVFPNLSGIRFLVPLLQLHLVRTLFSGDPRLRAPALALIGALAALAPDAGVAVALGVVAANVQSALSRRRSWRRAAFDPAVMLVGFAVGRRLIGFMLSRTGASESGAGSAVAFIRDAPAENSALTLSAPIAVIGVLGLLLCALALTRSVRLVGPHAETGWVVSTSTAGLLWFAYYFNRPVLEALQFSLILGLLASVPYLVHPGPPRPRGVEGSGPNNRDWSQGSRLSRAVLAVAAALVVSVPSALLLEVWQMRQRGGGDLEVAVGPCRASEVAFYGTCLTEPVAGAVDASLRELAALVPSSMGQRDVYVMGSMKSTLLAEGWNWSADRNLLFGEGLRSQRLMSDLAGALRDGGEPIVVVQNPESPLSAYSPLAADAYDELIGRLIGEDGGFVHLDSSDYWVALRREPSP